MASLIQNIPQNNVLTQINSAPKYSTNNFHYGTPTNQTTLSPEAKSTLWSGLMCGVLGGIWGAKPKFDADELIRLDNDAFTRATKNVQKNNLIAFNEFSKIRDDINNDIKSNMNFFFENKAEISKEDLLKKLSETSEKSLEKSITKLERQLSKTQEIDLNSFFNTKNDFNRLNKTQKSELKNAIGDELFSVLNKRKPNNIKDFILKRTEELNRKKFGLILCDTSTDSKITKSFSDIFINKKMIECYSEKISTAYKNIYDKLPKNRLKTAAKWFGMGICFSMLMNIIFGAIRSRKAQK